MNHKMLEKFEDCPVIAAIKDDDGLKKCLDSDIQIVFVLYGDICSISGIVSTLKKAGKTVIIHIDLIAGLSSKEIAVTYIKSVTHADGIISTRPAVIRETREEGRFLYPLPTKLCGLCKKNKYAGDKRQSERSMKNFMCVLRCLFFVV